MPVLTPDLWTRSVTKGGVKTTVTSRVPDIRMHTKGMFFDRAAVVRLVGQKTAQAMGKVGAFIRRRAQTSMRYRKSVSAPGTPPSAHKPRPWLRKYIWFAFDPNKWSLIVGPLKLNAVYWNHDGEPITGPVPNVLEFGGQIRVLEMWQGVHRNRLGKFTPASAPGARGFGKWVRADLRRKRKLLKRKLRLRAVTVRPRPYMGPALIAERANIPRAWSGSVRAA